MILLERESELLSAMNITRDSISRTPDGKHKPKNKLIENPRNQTDDHDELEVLTSRDHCENRRKNSLDFPDWNRILILWH